MRRAVDVADIAKGVNVSLGDLDVAAHLDGFAVEPVIREAGVAVVWAGNSRWLGKVQQGTEVVVLGPDGRRQGGCGFGAGSDIAKCVEGLGGEVARSVHLGGLLAQLVVEIVGGQPFSGLGVAQVGHAHQVAKGVVGVELDAAQGEICAPVSRVVVEHGRLRHRNHAASAVIGGEKVAAQAVAGAGRIFQLQAGC